jgi:hypothetical protein
VRGAPSPRHVPRGPPPPPPPSAGGARRSHRCARSMFFLMATLLIVVAAAVPRTARQYAVIFDAGSTGTRVHVFSWVALDGAAGVGGLPDVLAEPGGSKKVTPGISSFEAHPESAGASLTPLLELAERVVPASEHAHTLYVHALEPSRTADGSC